MYTDLSTTCKLILEAVSTAALRWVPWSWDRLGPGTPDCSACTWKNISSSNTTQRNCKGLKVTVCVHIWDKLWTVRYGRTQKGHFHFWRSGSKSRVCTRPLHSPHHRAGQTTQAPPPRCDPWTHPYFTPCKELSRTCLGELGKEIWLVFTLSCGCRSPNKALP